MIRYNYTQVSSDFQSIYNLHEMLITLAVNLYPDQADFDFISAGLEQASTTSLFPDFEPTQEYLKALYSSFKHYSDHDPSDKSVNG